MLRKTKKCNRPLTGQALLTKVKKLKKLKKLKNFTRDEKAKTCDYVTIEDDGSERINFMAFFIALLDEEEVNLDRDISDYHQPSKRQASCKASVQANGTVCIGAIYTKQLDLKPGDKFQIFFGSMDIQLIEVDED